MGIYSQMSGLSLQEVEAKFEGQGYGPFKKDLAEQIIAVLEPLQERYRDIRSSGQLEEVLRRGAERASAEADAIVAGVKERMGFLKP